MKKHIYLVLLGLMICSFASAAVTLPAKGKYYQFTNGIDDKYTSMLFEDAGTSQLWCNTEDAIQFKLQYWEYTTDGKLKNIVTGHYLQTASNTNDKFYAGTTGGAVTFEAYGDNDFLIKCGGYLNYNKSNGVLVWNNKDDKANHWQCKAVTLTQSQIETAQQAYQKYLDNEQVHKQRYDDLVKNKSKYETAFAEFFDDASCTQLKSAYQSMSDDDLKAAVLAKGLTEDFQNIAVKIKNKWSDELDGTTLSERFRVQEYGAYSVANSWRWRSDDGKGLNASQMNDMCNPSGIYTPGRDVLFVWVDGKVPTGCELRLSKVFEEPSGFRYNNYDNGQVLKQGLNIVSAEPDLYSYWVMYSVTDKNKKPGDMPKIKIHIEGGHVLGYVDTTDNEDESAVNSNYKQVLEHAVKSCSKTGAPAKQLRLAIKGNYGMFYFQVDTYNQIWAKTAYNGMNYTPGYKIYKSIRFYDNVLRWEWGSMGIMKKVHDATEDNLFDDCRGGEDLYPTYCNNLAYTIMGTVGGNPHSSTGYTHMPGVGAVESSYNGERANFDVWCAAHESGHNNQGAINLESSMESSNNFYSSIITYRYGYRLSRGGTFDENLGYFMDGKIFGHRDIGMTLRMYYNLYQYYHLAGHKTDFFPTFITSLRYDPIKMGTGDTYNDGTNGNARTHNARTSWLHVYKKACEAAQEDLTEYFRLWGFFFPCKNAFFGDYTNYYVTCTQKDIDDAIAWVKSHNWPENKQVIFIEDRQKQVKRSDPWAKSSDKRPDSGGTMRDDAFLKNTYGELGHYTDYMGEAVKGNYTYSVAGQSIKLTGTGGVGFLVYNSNGEVIYYLNKKSASLPLEVASNLSKVEVVNADGTTSVLENQTSPAEYRQGLVNVINTGKTYMSMEDKTGNKVGYYAPEDLATLKELLSQGQTTLDTNDEANYLPMYNKISNEIQNIIDNVTPQMPKPNAYYCLQNYRDNSRYISATTAGKITAATSKTSKNAQWFFVQGSNGKYYLQNYGTKKLLTATTDAKGKINGWNCDATTKDASLLCMIKAASLGYFFVEDAEGSKCMNLDGADHSKIAAWSEDDGSKWTITYVGEIENVTKADIDDLMNEASDLVKSVCDYTVATDKKTFQNTSADSPYYASITKADSDTSHGLAMCLDNKTTTYWISDRTASTTPIISLDLGAGNETSEFKIYYRTVQNMQTAKPTQVKVQGSNNATSGYTTIATYETSTNSTALTSAQTFTTPVYRCNTPYRYLRVNFSETTAEAGQKPYVALSVFNLLDCTTSVVLKPVYEGLDTSLVIACEDILDVTKTAEKCFATTYNYYLVYNPLKQKYDALLNAVHAITPEGINSVSVDNAQSGGVYDLTGRKVKNTNNGLYIINGKKVLVK